MNLRGRQNRVRRFARPTPWNRTRTSRASAERADQLRKSGIRAPRTRFEHARGARSSSSSLQFSQSAHETDLGRRCIRGLRGRTYRGRVIQSWSPDQESRNSVVVCVRTNDGPKRRRATRSTWAALHRENVRFTLLAWRTSVGTRIELTDGFPTEPQCGRGGIDLHRSAMWL